MLRRVERRKRCLGWLRRLLDQRVAGILTLQEPDEGETHEVNRSRVRGPQCRKTHHSVASATEKWPACTAAWICSSVNPISPRTRNNSPIVWKQRGINH